MSETVQNALVKKSEKAIDQVMGRIQDLQEDGQINFPANYSPYNALQAAWLIIQDTKDKNKKPALQVCSKESIHYALFDMVIQGLSVAKKQGYFIVYGDKLTFERSYFGSVAVAKRLKGVEDVFAQVIYKDDVFEYTIEQGRKKVVKHEQKIENIDINSIVGAYATIIYDGGKEYTEIMSKAQIDKSWSKTKMGKNSVQAEFSDQMALRTVFNRAAKIFINTSDDSDLMIEAVNRTTSNEYEDTPQNEIDEKANQEIIDIDPIEEYPEPEPEPQTNNQGPDF